MVRPMRLQAAACAILLCSGSALAQAPELARAMTLQPPAWVERGDSREALRPGAALYPGDRLHTGTGGRVHIELEDSSTIKLGEASEFELPALQVIDDGSDTGLLKGALKVLKGAFRFTTGAMSQFRKRDLAVYVGPAITSGIRGTDIFAKSDDKQDLLCLLEGVVEVSSPDAPVQTMDQPNTFYVVPRGQPAKPIIPTPPEKLATWLPSIEMRPTEAALQAGGRFRLVLLSANSEAGAAREAARFSALGYPVDVVRNDNRYRVALVGFASYDDALRYRQTAKQRLGVSGSWVMRP